MTKPKWWEGVLYVVIILGLQVFMAWMDIASTKDLAYALVMVPVAAMLVIMGRGGAR